jgi:hypothetical protein
MIPLLKEFALQLSPTTLIFFSVAMPKRSADFTLQFDRPHLCKVFLDLALKEGESIVQYIQSSALK